MNLGRHTIVFIKEKKRTFVLSFIFCQLIFLLFYVFSDRIYESKMELMSSSDGMSQLNLSAISSFLPTNMNGTLKSANIYSSILKSRSFAKEVFSEEIKINDQEITIYNWILDKYNIDADNDNIEFQTVYNFFKSDLISVRHNKVTDIVSVSIFSTNPTFSYLFLQACLRELEERLTQYILDSKLSKKEFIISRISVIEDDLKEIENNYINFLNQNSELSSPNLLIMKKRIEREMFIKENLLKELAIELEINKIESTRDNQVVIDLIDEPSLNLGKAYPRYSLFLLISLVTSFIIPFILHPKRFFIDN